MSPAAWTLTARWILPVSGPPLANGLVTIAGDTIAAVEPHGCRTPDLDLGNAAVIPGLVNAHTHLDLSSVPGRIPFDGDFTNWLRGVIAHRRSLTPEQVEAAVRTGLEESLAHGVTLLGDIAGQGMSWPELSEAGCRAVVYYEMIGLRRERARQAWIDVISWLKSHPETATCHPGLSPHASYSVHWRLFRSVSRLSEAKRLPLAVHVSESREEILLLARREGVMKDFLCEIGAWDDEGLVGYVWDLGFALDVVEACGGPRTSFVHANYFTPSIPFPRGSSAIYCPRTHAYFGHPPHPFRDFLKRGVRVALGTDSLASNPDLDLLAEARFLHRQYPEFPGATLLWMATLAGAEALGWADVTGSLAPGKSADLVAMPLPECDEVDPYRLLFESDLPGRRVLWRGQWR